MTLVYQCHGQPQNWGRLAHVRACLPCVPAYLYTFIYVHLSACSSLCASIILSICASVSASMSFSVSVCLFAYLCVHLSVVCVYTSVYPPVCPSVSCLYWRGRLGAPMPITQWANILSIPLGLSHMHGRPIIIWPSDPSYALTRTDPSPSRAYQDKPIPIPDPVTFDPGRPRSRSKISCSPKHINVSWENWSKEDPPIIRLS